MVTRIKIALPTAFPYQVGFADARRPPRQAAAVNDGAGCPAYKPFGATSNPDHRVPDATSPRASAPARPRAVRIKVNDPG